MINTVFGGNNYKTRRNKSLIDLLLQLFWSFILKSKSLVSCCSGINIQNQNNFLFSQRAWTWSESTHLQVFVSFKCCQTSYSVIWVKYHLTCCDWIGLINNRVPSCLHFCLAVCSCFCGTGFALVTRPNPVPKKPSKGPRGCLHASQTGWDPLKNKCVH